jgi:NitT/TauT family transport system ATP-binding protein
MTVRQSMATFMPAGLQPAGRTKSAYSAVGLGVTLPSGKGPLAVLRDINFEVAPGEIVAIVGRSGTGKTTLLRVLGGLAMPTEGRVCLHGIPIAGPPASAVTVFQDYTNALLSWRSVARNVGLGLERRVSKEERDSRVREALRLVDLEKFADELPWRLSGGMQQRVQIARALAMKPDVLLMDEPFGALDAITKQSLQDELLQVHEATRPTIIFITHDIDEAIYLSDRVFVIAGSPGSGEPGRLIMQSETCLPRPRDPVTTRELAQYLALRHTLVEALHVRDRDR